MKKVHFFDNEAEYSKGIEYYHNLMPETSANEVTYEKTPKYMVIPEVPGMTIRIILVLIESFRENIFYEFNNQTDCNCL